MRFTEAARRNAPKTCLAYVEENMLTPERQKEAHRRFLAALHDIPGLECLTTTVQTPPHHAEGPNVATHVERMLALILAFAEGATLVETEEFAREKDIRIDLEAVEETIHENVPMLSALALCHDVGKCETLEIGAVGAYCNTPLRLDKERRAYAAKHPELSERDASVGFFFANGIRAHYDRHERVSAGADFAATRDAALRHVGLGVAHTRLFSELILRHLDALEFFDNGVRPEGFTSLSAFAGRAGLNIDLFLRLHAALTLLDIVLGSLAWNGTYSLRTPLFVYLLRSEHEALPYRRLERLAAKTRVAKEARRALLAEAGLSPNDVFALLKTPIGPECGVVMRKVEDALLEPDDKPDFGEHSDEMWRRIAKARSLLDV